MNPKLKKNTLKLIVGVVGSTVLGFAYKAIDHLETRATDKLDERFDDSTIATTE